MQLHHHISCSLVGKVMLDLKANLQIWKQLNPLLFIFWMKTKKKLAYVRSTPVWEQRLLITE
ncbi:hypothetical protein RC55_15100 [Herbaspirillum seropedicae]|nr:hypothetical protein ACP92_14575 [Herbaspirillum seropedicae]NQE30566.1 hypothetical protein [Herbaspirillum seropedicae]